MSGIIYLNTMFYKVCYWILPRLGYVSTLSTSLLLSSSYSMSLLFIFFSASTNSTSCSHLAGVGGRTKPFLQFFFSTSFNLRLHHLGHHLIFPLLLNCGHLLCSDAFQMFGQLWNKQSLSALFNMLFPSESLVSSFSTRGVIAVFMSCSSMTVSTTWCQ